MREKAFSYLKDDLHFFHVWSFRPFRAQQHVMHPMELHNTLMILDSVHRDVVVSGLSLDVSSGPENFVSFCDEMLLYGFEGGVQVVLTLVSSFVLPMCKDM